MRDRRPTDLLRAALGMGVGRAAFRLAWELDRVTGMKRLRTPAGHVPVPPAIPTFDEWWAELSPRHWLRSVDLAEPEPERTLVEEAERAARGIFELFGGWEADVGDPPDWHLEPRSGRRWPADVHWTRAIDAPVGDLRTTWELNRFQHVWLWARVGDPAYGAAFERQLESWERANPFRAGINWASGQELAVRVIAWLVGVASFGDSMSRESFRRFVQLAYWHGFQIESELNFARRAVPNNHVIAEALGLAVLGDVFPDFDEADRWRTAGLDLLLDAVSEQFFDDGGYCQASHSYHRFALEMLLLADEWFPEIRGELDETFDRAVGYFDALVGEDGTLSNFGPNDGARMFRLSTAAPGDFRPLLERLQAGSLRSEDDGAQAASLRRTTSFPSAGIHQLVRGTHTAVLRCGPLPSRGGHSDALHVDVWIDDVPVAVDAGSFSYMSDEHEWFVSACSHNGCIIDGREPRELVGRFTWGDHDEPRLEEFDAARGFAVATYDSLAIDTCWERTVSVDDDGVSVADCLAPVTEIEFPHDYRLHWLLECDPESVELETTDQCATVRLPSATVRVSVRSMDRCTPSLGFELEPAVVSRHYGTTKPATNLVVRARGCGVSFQTRFCSNR